MFRLLRPFCLALPLLLSAQALTFAYGDTKPAQGNGSGHESNPFQKPATSPSTNPFQSQPVKPATGWSNPYGYRMQLPPALRLAQQDKQTWQFDSTGFWLRVTGWRNTEWTAKQVAFQQYEAWTQTSNKELSVQQDVTRLVRNSGAEAYLIEGTGIQSNKIVRFVFIGLHNLSTGNNLNLRFTWWNDPGQNARHKAEIEALLASIEAIKPAN